MQYNHQHALALLRKGSGRENAPFVKARKLPSTISSRDVGRLLVVQKTGWGKSFVYFIATKLLREVGKGPALLISPLLALMRNQVAAAQRMGVRAETINSENTDSWDGIETKLLNGDVDMLLISPERLANEHFRAKYWRTLLHTFPCWLSTKLIAFPTGAMISALTIDCWNASSKLCHTICVCWPPRQQQTTA